MGVEEKKKCSVERCEIDNGLIRCPYCQQDFCSFHLRPKAADDSNYFGVPKEMTILEKVQMYNGHFCEAFYESSMVKLQKNINQGVTFGDFIKNDGKNIKNKKERSIYLRYVEKKKTDYITIVLIVTCIILILFNILMKILKRY